MKIYKSLFEDHNITSPGIISIGYFDSMHLGHKKSLSELIRISKKDDFKSYVFTFKSLPSKDLKGKKLLELDVKLNLLKEIGIRYTILNDFSDKLSHLDPEKFLNILKDNFNIKHFVVGEDFSFGNNKRGHISTLNKLGFEYTIVKSLYIDKQKVSTSLIKEHILDGHIKKANKLLGYPFSIAGIVRKGKMLGRQLGFPTMNIQNNNVIYPSDGVYITKTYIKDKEYRSMTYVADPIIETFLIGYNIFHYNFEIKVDFFKKIRDNLIFNDMDLLKHQIEQDLIKTEHFYN